MKTAGAELVEKTIEGVNFAADDYEPLGRIGEGLESALPHLVNITPADQATVELCRYYARVIDAFKAAGDPALMVKGINFGALLMTALKELGATPASRGDLAKKAESEMSEDEKLFANIQASMPKMNTGRAKSRSKK